MTLNIRALYIGLSALSVSILTTNLGAQTSCTDILQAQGMEGSCISLDNKTFIIKRPLQAELPMIKDSVENLLASYSKNKVLKREFSATTRLGDAYIVRTGDPVLKLENEPQFEGSTIKLPMRLVSPYRIKVDYKKARHGEFWHQVDGRGEFIIEDWQGKIKLTDLNFNRFYGAHYSSDRKRLNTHWEGVHYGIAAGIAAAAILTQGAFLYAGGPVLLQMALIESVSSATLANAGSYAIWAASSSVPVLTALSGSAVIGAHTAEGLQVKGLKTNIGRHLAQPETEPQKNAIQHLMDQYRLDGWVEGNEMVYRLSER